MEIDQMFKSSLASHWHVPQESKYASNLQSHNEEGKKRN
jgi:hypothetical protein